MHEEGNIASEINTQGDIALWRQYCHRIEPMSRVATALQITLSDLQWTQTQLATNAGLTLPQVNRYVRGNSAIGADVIERICSILPEEHRAKLICAYLEDLMPASGRDLVQIVSSAVKSTNPSRAYSQAPPAVREALDAIAAVAATRRDVADLLVRLRQVLNA